MMAQILRIPANEHLNISSQSPFSKKGSCTPSLGVLPWKAGHSASLANKGKFGSPGYPSPLDRFRCRQRDSPLQHNASFSHLPRSRRHNGLHHAASLPRLSVMPGNGLHSFSFSPGLSKGSFGVSENVPGGQWLFRNFVGGGSCGPVFPTSIVNPNKAVLTVDSTSRILTANDMSSLLLGHPEDKLCGKMKLTDFITHPRTHEALSSLSTLSPSSESESSDCSLRTLPDPDILENQGMVLFSGKVVNVNTYDNGMQPCSLWLKGLSPEAEEEQRWIAVLEPVDITVAKASVDETGRILKHDPSFNSLFGYADNSELSKLNIQDLVPAIKVPEPRKEIPKDIEKQQCTGQTVDCATFPLCAHFTQDQTQYDQVVKKIVFDLEIWVFSNISGLVVLDGSGNIIDYNHNFTRLLFGYGKKELQGAAITHLIPTFFDDVALMMNSPSYESEQSDSAVSDNEADNQKENTKQVNGSLTSCSKSSLGVSTINSEQSLTTANCAFVASDSNQGSMFSSTMNSTNNFSIAEKTENSFPVTNAMRDITNSMNVLNLSQQNASSNSNTSNIQSSPSKARLKQGQVSTPIKSLPKAQIEACQDITQSLSPTDMVTSTPAVGRNKVVGDLGSIEEGSFFGVGKHKDGSDLVIIYQIRRVELNGSPHYCVWILRDPEEPAEGLRSNVSFTLASTFSENAESSLGHAIKVKARGESHQKDDDGDTSSDEENDNSQTSTDGSSGAEYSLNHSRRGNRDASTASCPDEAEEKLLAGDFADHYTVLRQIGKGAFGCVKMSYRNSDGLLVVTKFIKKNKVYQDSWVNDILLRKKVPLEVSLLMTLDHPNIVSVLDLFENDDFFQLVMEKWGAGMDLFEFIDRNPVLDEPLAAHIFRQIVSALAYLHSLNIIHRDVKDENVILDNQFHVKLIDFGSSAFTKPGKLFSQFAGTVEYCSPEVLKGNKYSGYELEVWSLGVTLYTLMYGENPFYDVDETIKAELTFPFAYSHDLCSLLKGMLKKDVKTRMTLPQVEAHPWTKQSCEIENYRFHEVVRCSYDEIYPKKYITDYSESDTSLSTTSHSFVFEDYAQTTRRSLSFTPQGSKNDNDNVRMQRSATSLSSSRIASEASEEDSIYDPSVSIGESRSSRSSRSSTSQSMSSVRSTITVDSSSFSCCSPSSESTESSDSSTQLDSTPSSVSVTCYDNVSTSSNTLSQPSSEGSGLEKIFTKYHRFDTSEYNDSDYENVRESDLSDYENVRSTSDPCCFEVKHHVRDHDDDDDGTESQVSLADALPTDNEKPQMISSDEDLVEKDSEFNEISDCQCWELENSCNDTNFSETAYSGDIIKAPNSFTTSCDNPYWCGVDGPVDNTNSVSDDTSNSQWDDLDTP